MTTKGVDYSFARPKPSAIKAAGYAFAVRYLSGGVSGKDIDAAELKALRAAGLEVAFVWERDKGAALKGRAQGVADAKAAAAQLKALGVPAGTPVYFACDVDAEGSSITKALAYVGGAVSVLGHDSTGLYGGLHVIEAAAAAHSCRFLWQTLAWSRVNGVTKWCPAAQLRQTGGAKVPGCDGNTATVADFGQYPRPAAPVVTKPTPAPKPTPVPAPVPTPRPVPALPVVKLSDLRWLRSTDSSLTVSRALVAEHLIAVARSRWTIRGNGAALRTYRTLHKFGKDTEAALKALGKAHGFTVAP